MRAPSLSRKPAPPVGQINGTDRPVGPPIPVQKLRQPGRSKRPLMLALMVLLMVLSALAAWFFVQKSTQRVAVVGVAHDVAWGQEIQASDLVAVEVVPDPALKPVSWDQRATLVGQLAATDLQTGMLLTAQSATDQQIPPPGRALVGDCLEISMRRDEYEAAPFTYYDAGGSSLGQASLTKENTGHETAGI